MRTLVQRVSRASVSVGGNLTGEIGSGLLVLAGMSATDDQDELGWMARKIVNLRIFDDDAGVMNRSVIEAGGGVLAVSQFTLFASTRKGNRPSYSAAAPPALAQPLFERFVGELATQLGRGVPTGVFGANMDVALVNNGPVTIWLDSRTRE